MTWQKKKGKGKDRKRKLPLFLRGCPEGKGGGRGGGFTSDFLENTGTWEKQWLILKGEGIHSTSRR